MSFPDDPLDLRVQLLLFGEWVDMGRTSSLADDFFTDEFTDEFLGHTVWEVRRLPEQDITITHGRIDETDAASPASVSLYLWNEDGYLTLGDPRSPWWSDDGTGWGKNTPLRILIEGTVVFYGEVAEANPQWPVGDLSDELTDEELVDLGSVDTGRLGYAIVNITATGVLRRLGQGAGALRSPIHRLVTKSTNRPHVSDYWPFEDGANATFIASGLKSTPDFTPHRMAFTGLTLSSDPTLAGSDPLPTVASGDEAVWAAEVDGFDGEWTCEVVGLRIPESPNQTNQSVRLMQIESTDLRWLVDIGYELDVDEHPFIRVQAQDASGVFVVDSTLQEPSIFGDTPQAVRLNVSGSGTVEWSLSWAGLSAGVDTLFGIAGTGAGSAGRPTLYSGGVTKCPPGGVTMGQVIFHDGISNGWLAPADSGWIDERVLRRLIRLTGEEEVPFTYEQSEANDSTPMGAQLSDPFVDLINECEFADLGLLSEERDTYGLHYLTRRARYNRAPALTLNARDGDIAIPFEPVGDDQNLRNNIALTRISGATVEVSDPSSAPVSEGGIGVYPDAPSVSLASDDQNEDQANWRLHLGMSHTGLRYPVVTIDLTVAPHLLEDVFALREGDVIRITDLPPQHPIWPADLDLVVLGDQYQANSVSLVVSLNCASAVPWTVAIWGESRYHGDSTLASAVDADDTSLSLATVGELWTVDPGDFPFDLQVGPEVMTVTAISGASSPQTATVVRNVNLLARAHSAGTSVTPADMARLGL